MSNRATQFCCAASLGLGLTWAAAATAQEVAPAPRTGPVLVSPGGRPAPAAEPAVLPFEPPAAAAPPRGVVVGKPAAFQAQPQADAPAPEPLKMPKSAGPAVAQPAPVQVVPAPTPTLPAAGGYEAWGWGGGTFQGDAQMIGRGDQNNRFNIFNNQSAPVQSHAWFGYQYQHDYNSGVRLTAEGRAQLAASGLTPGQFFLPQGLTGDIAQRNTQMLYRAGVEYGLSPSCSIILQGLYAHEQDTQDPANGWGNPQIALKTVVCNGPSGVVSAVIAVEPETHVTRGQFKEQDTRIYPGVLYYNESGNWVVQGGVQAGIAVRGSERVETFEPAHTLDWALSLGYWWYRSPCLMEGKTWRPFACEATGPCVQGVMTQVEILGKHVFGRGTVVSPFHTENILFPGVVDPGAPALFEFVEPRDVVDVTLGGRVLLRNHVSLSAGVSFPITNEEVRKFEVLVNLSCDF